jgi:hypothetical protein
MIVKESIINEFERGKDPKISMGVGNISKLEKDLEKENFKLEDVEILDDFTLLPKINRWGFDSDKLKAILKHHMTPEKVEFINTINVRKAPFTIIKNSIKKILNKGVNKESIEKLLKHYGEDSAKERGPIALSEFTRSEEEESQDNSQNIYAFIGYPEKTPIEINSKKYYEDKWVAENMMKINKFDPQSLMMVSGMKTRQAHQRHEGGGVYMLFVDKNIMDEDNYYEMPDFISDNFESFLKQGFIKKIG